MVEEGEKVNGGGSVGKELALLPSSSSAAPSSSYYPASAADVSSAKNCVYPPPLAKYDDIIANQKVFMTTLEKFHASMRTKFMIPIIGGKELDLHRLFVEVTSRGGIEKVVRERKWKEITSCFKFPSTATNASFILRKYYISLIHHYEQLYYFGAKCWDRSEPELSPNISSMPTPVKTTVPPVSSSQFQVPPNQQPNTAKHPLGSPVVGVIDGKFENGYLVTVSIGTQMLHGVLYNGIDTPGGQGPQYHILNANNSFKAMAPLAVRRRRRRKKCEMKKRDPDHPKPNRSGYNFFFQEHHAKLKPLHPGKDRDISKMIGELWSKLTETEKAVYQDKGLRDKERYQSEMQEYKERLRMGQIISDAVPIQQRQAEPDVVMREVGQNMEAEDDKVEANGEESDDDQMEDDSSNDGSDSDGKIVEKDSEMEVSVGGENRINSANADAPNHFELRKRDLNVEAERNEDNVQDLNL